MSLKSAIWLMRFLAVASAASIAYLIIYTSPYDNERAYANVALFLGSIFIFVAALSSGFLYWLRKKAFEDEIKCVHLAVSVRQGALLALSLVALLVLQVFNVLTWWDGLLAIGAIFMVELYFLTR
jgi:hypothetical protein